MSNFNSNFDENFQEMGERISKAQDRAGKIAIFAVTVFAGLAGTALWVIYQIFAG